jgi:hypothetical protein
VTRAPLVTRQARRYAKDVTATIRTARIVTAEGFVSCSIDGLLDAAYRAAYRAGWFRSYTRQLNASGDAGDRQTEQHEAEKHNAKLLRDFNRPRLIGNDVKGRMR